MTLPSKTVAIMSMLGVSVFVNAFIFSPPSWVSSMLMIEWSRGSMNAALTELPVISFLRFMRMLVMCFSLVLGSISWCGRTMYPGWISPSATLSARIIEFLWTWWMESWAVVIRGVMVDSASSNES